MMWFFLARTRMRSCKSITIVLATIATLTCIILYVYVYVYDKSRLTPHQQQHKHQHNQQHQQHQHLHEHEHEHKPKHKHKQPSLVFDSSSSSDSTSPLHSHARTHTHSSSFLIALINSKLKHFSPDPSSLKVNLDDANTNRDKSQQAISLLQNSLSTLLLYQYQLKSSPHSNNLSTNMPLSNTSTYTHATTSIPPHFNQYISSASWINEKIDLIRTILGDETLRQWKSSHKIPYLPYSMTASSSRASKPFVDDEVASYGVLPVTDPIINLPNPSGGQQDRYINNTLSDSTPPLQKANAAIVILCRNKDLPSILTSLRSFEDRFNKRYLYPYVFINDVPFLPSFQDTVRSITLAEVKFGVVDQGTWEYPSWVNKSVADQCIQDMAKKGIMYGGNLPYRHMCRW